MTAMFFEPTDILDARADAESVMVDECTIERVTGTVTDPTTGQVTQTWATIYPTSSGKGWCRVQGGGLQATATDVAGHLYTLQSLRVDLPVTAGPVEVDDRVTVTAAVYDPQLAARIYRVTALMHKSFASAQRLSAEEVVA